MIKVKLQKKPKTTVNRNTFFYALLFIGLLLVSLSAFNLYKKAGQPYEKPNESQYKIGYISKLGGRFEKVISKDKFASLKKNNSLFSNETYQLQEGSSLVLRLADETLSLRGPCLFKLAVFSPERKEVYVNFLTLGEIKEKSLSDKIKLTYKGWRIQPQFQESELQNEKSQGFKPLTLSESKPQEKQQSATAKSFDEIDWEFLVAKKRDLLRKCYENYLRKNPLAKGIITIEFNLQNSGKVSSARVEDSSFFKDETFRACIIDVFLRIKTEPFSGSPVPVQYPIEFN